MEIRYIEKDIQNFLAEQFSLGRPQRCRAIDLCSERSSTRPGTLVLVTYLQEQFEIAVDDEDVVPNNLDSVEKMAAYVARKLQVKAYARRFGNTAIRRRW